MHNSQPAPLHIPHLFFSSVLFLSHQCFPLLAHSLTTKADSPQDKEGDRERGNQTGGHMPHELAIITAGMRPPCGAINHPLTQTHTRGNTSVHTHWFAHAHTQPPTQPASAGSFHTHGSNRSQHDHTNTMQHIIYNVYTTGARQENALAQTHHALGGRRPTTHKAPSNP
jgi:hypothetical protein